MNNGDKRKIISLFSGAGCFDIGFEAAGFKTILTNDSDSDCCDTIRINRKCEVLQAPIEELSSSLISNLSNIKKRELDLLIGGPPCQPYSKSSYGVLGSSYGFDDSRGQTLRDYFRIVDDLLPKAFIIENVPQFITGDNTRVKTFMESTVARINRNRRTNYKLNFCKINAANYGVPQTRERLFIVASRSGISFTMPEPRHFANPDSELNMQPMRTAWDAIGDINISRSDREYLNVGGRWGDLLETIPAGSNYLWHTERGGGKNIFKWRSRYWNFLLKLHPLLPSWTIAASPGQHTGPFHWEGRRLSSLELQLLQTIPADYIISGGLTSVRKQIGNGVPPALGELLGKEVRRQFFGDKVTSEKLKLIPDAKYRPANFNRKYPVIQLSQSRVVAST
ncbi:DNA cytosine methyltransferase [Bdellovibrio sp.]|uniref:DNA cytosine methyltransferase n=1 Tax=Bdellovibrio sp. TaxID=28201 RepID=UPI0039E56AB4